MHEQARNGWVWLVGFWCRALSELGDSYTSPGRELMSNARSHMGRVPLWGSIQGNLMDPTRGEQDLLEPGIGRDAKMARLTPDHSF